MNGRSPKERQLTRDMFAIMVALTAGEQTGSDVQGRVIGDAVGLYIRNSSLYAVLHRLVEMGLAEENGKFYRLTETGWTRLRIETKTFESLIDQAKRRFIASGRGRW